MSFALFSYLFPDDVWSFRLHSLLVISNLSSLLASLRVDGWRSTFSRRKSSFYAAWISLHFCLRQSFLSSSSSSEISLPIPHRVLSIDIAEQVHRILLLGVRSLSVLSLQSILLFFMSPTHRAHSKFSLKSFSFFRSRSTRRTSWSDQGWKRINVENSKHKAQSTPKPLLLRGKDRTVGKC